MVLTPPCQVQNKKSVILLRAHIRRTVKQTETAEAGGEEQSKRSAQSDLVVEQGSIAVVCVYCTQQAVKHVTQDLQVWGAGGEQLQLHRADLREQQDATPGTVHHRHKLPQHSRLHL